MKTTQRRGDYLADQKHLNSAEGKREMRAINAALENDKLRITEETMASTPYPRFLKAEGRYQDDPDAKGHIPGKVEEAPQGLIDLHARMESRRYANWLAGSAGTRKEQMGGRPRLKDGIITRDHVAETEVGGWYRKNNPDLREKFMAKMVKLELHPESYVSKLRKGLTEFLTPEQINQIWAKTSIYGLVRDMLTKPTIEVTQHEIRTLNKRTTSKPRKLVDDYGTEHTVLDKDYEYFYTKGVQVESNANEVSEWTTIHKALNGHGSMDFLPQPATMTLFCNPDGSRHLNRTKATGSPIQAKMAFCRNHKVDAQEVMVERVTYEKGSKMLSDLGLPDKQLSLWVVAMRKLSDQTASTYYDPDPAFEQRVGPDAEWIRKYRWESGEIMKRQPGGMIPEGAHILSVRDFENAIISGATIAENQDDLEAFGMERLETSVDDRFRTDDPLPRKDARRLSEDEQFIQGTLIGAGYYDLAELMLIDFASPIGAEANEAIRSMMVTLFDPSDDNPHWTALTDEVHLSQKHRYRHLEPVEAARKADYITDKIVEGLEGFLNNLSPEVVEA